MIYSFMCVAARDGAASRQGRKSAVECSRMQVHVGDHACGSEGWCAMGAYDLTADHDPVFSWSTGVHCMSS